MKNNKATTIILLALGLVGLFFAIRYYDKKQSWYENYTESKKDPYTLYLTAKILKNYYPDHHFYPVKKSFVKTLKKKNNASGNYLFFGDQFYISETGVDSLLSFIEKGNNAFIATKRLPYSLIFRLFSGNNFCREKDYTGEEAIFDELANVNLIHPNLQIPGGNPLKFMGRYKARTHRWNFIPTRYICDSGFHAAGTLNNKFVNFGYIPYGKGRVYFHTNPVVFTNYFMVREKGKKYLDGIMAHLKDDNIYYEIAARSPIIDRQQNRNNHRRTPSFGNQGPLTYILSQRPLAIAWYLLMSIGVLFLAFRGKRKQRIIPIVEKNENTSLIFIQNISNLYFQQGNNKQLSIQKFIHFQDFVRSKYALNFKKNTSDFAVRLAQKSGIAESKIHEILTIHDYINNSTYLSDATLTKFHMAINHFYKNCK